ncbi:unnamed protein product [Allacma fusca]|uniref:Myb/SANT-like DNA-binding domain-containing protein n=1 Tax=Allacma fusca TaxID=39272 RepID=A0A8J2L965_9HEXA|nr:unnamed protein product [Allacma fusca]
MSLEEANSRTKRDGNWRANEIKKLITLYAEKFAELEIMCVQKPIYEWISKKLLERNIVKNQLQVMRKISWLRQEYRKQNPGPTGGAPSKWEFYLDLHKILHERPSLNSAAAETSEIGLDDSSEIQTSFSTDSQPSTPISITAEDIDTASERCSPEENETGKRKRRRTENSDVVKIAKSSFEFMKVEANKRAEMREELKTFNDQILRHFDRMATASERLVDAMVNCAGNSPHDL